MEKSTAERSSESGHLEYCSYGVEITGEQCVQGRDSWNTTFEQRPRVDGEGR